MKKIVIISILLGLLNSPCSGEFNPDGKLGFPVLTFSWGAQFGDYKDKLICEECTPHYDLFNRKYELTGHRSFLSILMPTTEFLSLILRYDYQSFKHTKTPYALYDKQVDFYGCSVWNRSSMNSESLHTISIGLKVYTGH